MQKAGLLPAFLLIVRQRVVWVGFIDYRYCKAAVLWLA